MTTDSNTAGCRFRTVSTSVRSEILAAAPDDVLLPVDEVVVSIRVAGDVVTGVEPEVAPSFDGLVGLADVAREHREGVAGSHDELAPLAVRDGPVVVVHDPGLDKPEGGADRTHPDGAGRVHQGGATALGHSVQFNDGEAESLFELRPERLGRAGREGGPHTVGAVSWTVGLLDSTLIIEIRSETWVAPNRAATSQ